jgi:hypothetical protein
MSFEHRGIASAACPHVALSGLCQRAIIHSFFRSFIHDIQNVNIKHVHAEKTLLNRFE